MTPVIDKGVPLPACKGKYAWVSVMQIGDSAFLAGIDAQRAYGAIKYAMRRCGFKFTLRTVTEDGVKGVRVWRVK